MCGRFYIDPDDERELEQLFGQASNRSGSPEDKPVKTGEVFPSDSAAVLCRSKSGAPGGFPMLWGMAGTGGRGLVINARSETADQRPMFRESVLSRRCLVPALCYYEWEKRGADKIKYAIHPAGQRFMWLAGLYAKAEGQPPRFVILTRPADESVAFIHDRMPVIIPDELRSDWLSPSVPFSGLLSAALGKMESAAV